MRTVCGVGVNDSNEQVRKTEWVNGKGVVIWECPYYKVWSSMLTRCYSSKYHEKYKTYISVQVCDDWLRFSKFKSWMSTQKWEGRHLDKDILSVDRLGKVYSPETCCFVHPRVNVFVVQPSKGISCWIDKRTNKYVACCTNPITGKREYFGRFSDRKDAIDAWYSAKHRFAIELANSEFVDDDRVKDALCAYYETYHRR